MAETLKAVGEHLGLSTKTVALHRDAKVIPDPRHSTLDAIRLAYIAHLREIAAGRSSKDGTLDLAAERARLTQLMQQKAQIDIDVRRGELIEASAIGSRFSMVIAALRVNLQGVPSRVRSQAPHLVAGDLALMTELIDQALNDAADAIEALAGGQAEPAPEQPDEAA